MKKVKYVLTVLAVFFAIISFYMTLGQPCSAAIYSFIPDNAGNQVTIFRTYYNAFGAAISIPLEHDNHPVTVGSGPFGIALALDSDSVYVTNSGDNTVTFINTDIDDPDGFLDTLPIPVGDTPHGVAISPDGKRVFVANYDSNTMSVINNDEDAGDDRFKVENTKDTGPEPFGVAVHPNGKAVYVTNSGFYTISVFYIDTDGAYDYLQKVDIGSGVGSKGIAIASSIWGTFIYVVSSTDGTVWIYDAAVDHFANPEIEPIYKIVVGNDPYGVAVSPDGLLVYVTNRGDNTVSVIENSTTGITVTKTINVGDSPCGVAVPNDIGKYIYVANSGDGTISVIDRDYDYGDSNADVFISGIGTPIAFGNFNVNLILAPTNLKATAVSSYQVDLSWTEITKYEKGFQIYIKVGGYWKPAVGEVDKDATTFTHTGLRPRSTYTYRLRSYEEHGDITLYSDYSNEAMVSMPEDDADCFINTITHGL